MSEPWSFREIACEFVEQLEMQRQPGEWWELERWQALNPEDGPCIHLTVRHDLGQSMFAVQRSVIHVMAIDYAGAGGMPEYVRLEVERSYRMLRAREVTR